MIRRGFTIIEVLVVVAIIALLLSLLFPVLTGARDKALRANCAGNLRQVGFIVNAFSMDRGGLPLPKGDGANPKLFKFDTAAELVGYMNENSIPPSIWYCPAQTNPNFQPDMWMNHNNHWDVYNEFPLGYFYFGNPQNIVESRWAKDNYDVKFYHQLTSDTVLMVDINASREHKNWAQNVSNWSSYPHYGLSKPNGSNYLMGDLSVIYRPVTEQVPGFIFSSGAYYYW